MGSVGQLNFQLANKTNLGSNTSIPRQVSTVFSCAVNK